MHPLTPTARRVRDGFQDGGLTRREFVGRLLKLGLSASAAGAVLAGCIRSEKSTPLPDVRGLKGRVQVLTGFGRGHGPDEAGVERALAEAFIRTRDDVGVDFIRAAGPAEARAKLSALVAAGAPPDLVLPIGIEGISRFVEHDTWLDLREFLDRDDLSLDPFLPQTARAAAARAYYGDDGGAVVGLPLGVHVDALACNLGLFSAAGLAPPPTSWNDGAWRLDRAFLDAARTLTRRPGQFGIGRLSPATSFFAFGGHFYERRPRKVPFDSAAGRAGLQFAADLVHRHGVQPTKEQLTALAGGAADQHEAERLAWRAGKVAMVELCSCEIAAHGGVPFPWQAAAMPAGPARRFTALDVDLVAMTRVGRNHDLAWELLKFMTLDPAQERQVATDAFGAIPALRENRDSFVAAAQGAALDLKATVWLEGLAARVIRARRMDTGFRARACGGRRDVRADRRGHSGYSGAGQPPAGSAGQRGPLVQDERPSRLVKPHAQAGRSCAPSLIEVSMFESVFAALTVANVRYVVVGGVAVVLHGHPRLTADLDLVVDLAPDAAAAAIDALLGLGLVSRLPVEPHDFADPEVRAGWIADRNVRVFSLHDPTDALIEVDLFAESPLPFEELYERSGVVRLGSASVHVASIEDLIAMKRMAARPQDLADIHALEAIMEAGHDT